MRLIDADSLDNTIHRLNEQGWDITRSEYKRIDGVVFEMPTVCDIEAIRAEIKDAYDDNRACEQNDVAYGLKIALDIIDEYKGV